MLNKLFQWLGCSFWFIVFLSGAAYVCSMVIRLGLDKFLHTYMPY